MQNEKVIVGIASIPQREEALKDTCESLYKQADEIHIYLNGYGEGYKPKFIGKKKKYKVYNSEVYSNNGDAGKFFKLEESEGFYFGCDDDIIYPEDYVKTMVKKIVKYDKKAIVGIHGVTLVGKVRSYYKNRNVDHCLGFLKSDKRVHILGTGACAFHTDAIKLKYADFVLPNMADCFLGVYAQQQKVPMVCVSHKKDWIKLSDKVNPKETIYEAHKNSDNPQTKVIHQVVNWFLY